MVESYSTIDPVALTVKDYIGFQQDAFIMRLIGNERLFFADKMKKTNVWGWVQERTLIITQNNIYNIKKCKI